MLKSCQIGAAKIELAEIVHRIAAERGINFIKLFFLAINTF
jgi:hypothetical protein